MPSWSQSFVHGVKRLEEFVMKINEGQTRFYASRPDWSRICQMILAEERKHHKGSPHAVPDCCHYPKHTSSREIWTRAQASAIRGS